MAKVLRLQFDGQSVIQTDYNALGEQAGLSEDHVFAELFRLTPTVGSVARGILPFAHAGSTSANGATVVAAGATGRVDVNPVRAFIGSRTLAGTDALANWQDVRGGLSVAAGGTALALPAALAANSSGNPRWDLVYAIVTVDAVSTPVTRKVKNPGTGVVTDESVSVSTNTTVTVGVVTGTPGASPAFPATPADAGSVYYINLAYVRVPDGFGASSTVANKDINEVAPILLVSRTAGASTLRPASGQNTGGAGIIGAGTSTYNGILAWTGTAASRPGVYMPPSMTGMESRLIAIDIAHASSANWSHQNNDIVDGSIDWRKRLFKWVAYIATGAVTVFPWNAAGNAIMVGAAADAQQAPYTSAFGGGYQMGFGQSFVNDATTTLSACYLHQGVNVPAALMDAGADRINFYVDASTGALKIGIAGSPAVSVLLWLDATAPFANA